MNWKKKKEIFDESYYQASNSTGLEITLYQLVIMTKYSFKCWW